MKTKPPASVWKLKTSEKIYNAFAIWIIGTHILGGIGTLGLFLYLLVK